MKKLIIALFLIFAAFGIPAVYAADSTYYMPGFLQWAYDINQNGLIIHNGTLMPINDSGYSHSASWDNWQNADPPPYIRLTRVGTYPNSEQINPLVYVRSENLNQTNGTHQAIVGIAITHDGTNQSDAIGITGYGGNTVNATGQYGKAWGGWFVVHQKGDAEVTGYEVNTIAKQDRTIFGVDGQVMGAWFVPLGNYNSTTAIGVGYDAGNYPTTKYHYGLYIDQVHDNAIYVNGAGITNVSSKAVYLDKGAGIYIDSISGGTAPITFGNDSTTKWQIGKNTDDTFYIYNGVTGEIPVYIDAADNIRIDANAEVYLDNLAGAGQRDLCIDANEKIIVCV